MKKKILIDASFLEEIRVAIWENKKLLEYDYDLSFKKQLKGNIYLAKITRVEPSLQAAFIDFGGDKHGFLPFSEIHPNYFNIPVADREPIPEDNKEQLERQFSEITPPDLSDNSDDEDDLKLLNKNSDTDKKKKDSNLDAEPENIEIDEVVEDSKLRNVHKNYKIQEVIKKNQIILVQAMKEERGNKGASFTSFISLAGRYCILMPNSDKQGGVSKRIEDPENRERLKAIIDSFNNPEDVSVIIRTAGEFKKKSEIKRDYDYLVRLWNNIRQHTIASKAPEFIHAESDVIKRTIRDLFNEDIGEILVQGEDKFVQVKDLVKKLVPNKEKNIKLFKGYTPIFSKFGIEEQITSLYSHIVQLNSGGYLVINTAEALTAIDVNSGKSIAERNIEETAYKTNLEAAKEIAKQVRLRDISGLIVIDFIDMVDYQNRKSIERILKDAVKFDRARIQISNLSNFGLIEMSRQRLKSSFHENNSQDCKYCLGKGRVKNKDVAAISLLRNVINECSAEKIGEIIIHMHIDNLLYIVNEKRNLIKDIEDRYNIKIRFINDPDASVDRYAFDRIVRENVQSEKLANTPTVDEEKIEIDDIEVYEDSEEEDSSFEPPKRNYHNKRRRRDQSSRRYRSKGGEYKKKGIVDSEEKAKNVKKSSWWSKIFG